jgi:hypothetical protein
MRTVLQVPMTADLRRSATIAAENMGFSSLQETVRLFLRQLTTKQINISFAPQTVEVSPGAEKRYLKIDQDLKSGKAITYKANNINDLMEQLNGKRDPVRSKISKKLS